MPRINQNSGPNSLERIRMRICGARYLQRPLETTVTARAHACGYKGQFQFSEDFGLRLTRQKVSSNNQGHFILALQGIQKAQPADGFKATMDSSKLQ